MDTPRRRPNDDVFVDSDDEDFRSSTWNFIENNSSSRVRRSESYLSSFNRPTYGGRGTANGVETRSSFREIPSTPVSATRTASTYQFHYVTRRVSSTGERRTTVELERSSKDLPEQQQQQERVVQREIPVQMVGNGHHHSATSYSRYSMANDVIQRYSSQSSSSISPHQRLSSYSLHSIVERMKLFKSRKN
uniref:Uncharacterized protein n=1 Tax=Caenorhabditis tropicalis TaxID=1561998 RepID=A0A1I7UAW7_9PELO